MTPSLHRAEREETSQKARDRKSPPCYGDSGTKRDQIGESAIGPGEQLRQGKLVCNAVFAPAEMNWASRRMYNTLKRAILYDCAILGVCGLLDTLLGKQCQCNADVIGSCKINGTKSSQATTNEHHPT